MKYQLIIASFLLFLLSCGSKQAAVDFNDPLLYCRTVKKLNDVVLYNNFSPVIASRNYVYANIAAYECIAAGDSSYQSLAGQIRHLPPLPAASTKNIDFSLAALLAFIRVGNAVTFPEGVLMNEYNNLLQQARDGGMPSSKVGATKAFADTIAQVVLAWSRQDQYAQTRTAEKYTISAVDGKWVPTPPAYTQAMEPHWCDIRTMALDSADQVKLPDPPPFNNRDSLSVFYKEMMEVKNTVDHLTEEQKHIAEFFDDNPFKLEVTGHIMMGSKKFSPPGHWMNIVGIAAEKSGADFNTTVAAYTATSIAIFDGFIACWKTKYATATVRPETVIRKYVDANWEPYIQTPPFPSYVSGHSVISAASAETMSSFFGESFQFTDTSLNEFGIRPRSFRSFREASMEASWSRLYGGIHFRSDLEQGMIMGTEIGKQVMRKLTFRKRKDSVATVK